MDTKFAFKGFDKDLKCRSFQYVEGETYTMEESRISLCSRGFHFCYRMKDVFQFYRNDGKNQFAIVEPLGKILKGSDKAVTNQIRIVKILSPSDLDKFLMKEDSEYYENEVFVLDVVQELQKKFNLSVGGSVALFIQGLMLKRESNQVDLDIILPYYQRLNLDNSNDDESCIEEIEEFGGKASGNDFSQTYGLSTKDGRFIKMDVRVRPEQKYEVVNYNGFEYKVCDILTILEAKMRYAIEGDKKHREDLYKLLNFNPKKSQEKEEKVTDLFELFK
jgi:hypothetical protein